MRGAVLVGLKVPFDFVIEERSESRFPMALEMDPRELCRLRRALELEMDASAAGFTCAPGDESGVAGEVRSRGEQGVEWWA